MMEDADIKPPNGEFNSPGGFFLMKERLMRKKHAIFWVYLAALLSLSSVALAVEFGPDSAKITNPYFPLDVGEWNFMLGVGPDWAGKVTYTHAVGIEEVSGAQIGTKTFNHVRCLKINMIRTELDEEAEFVTFWMAQDTEGNLWSMKVYLSSDDETYLLGNEYKSKFMPAAPDVGESASIIIPENASTYCRVAETDMSITSNSGSYDGCIKVQCQYNSTIESADYYCPNVGMVKYTDVEDPQGHMDLNEFGTATVTRTVVIPLMD
jgi:hypothetical protein